MDPKRRQQIAAMSLLLILAAVLLVLLRIQPRETSPAEPDYYSGPRRSKWNPNVWVNSDGKIVPPPPGARPLPVSAPGEKPGSSMN
jgi:hypothetical protein